MNLDINLSRGYLIEFLILSTPNLKMNDMSLFQENCDIHQVIIYLIF